MRLFENVNPVECFDLKPAALSSMISGSREYCPECDQLLGYVKKGKTAESDGGGLSTCKKGFYICTNKDAHEGKNAYYVGKKKSGRRKLPADRLRSVSVACKLTEAETAIVDSLRGGMGKGEWLRVSAFGNAPRPIPKINREAWADLARMGGNLNQISKRLNEDQRNQLDMEGLIALVNKLRMSLIAGDGELK
jgi:hypothetical protein